MDLKLWILHNNHFRGAIIKKKNGKIWEKFPNLGGGVKNFSKKSPNFNLGTSKIQGGDLNFSKMSEFQTRSILPSWMSQHHGSKD